MTREEAIKVLSSYDVNGVWADVDGKPYNAEEQAEAFDMAIEALQADPVKHGEWEQHDGCVLCKDDDTYFYTCSCCKMAITEAERGLFNFCPNCGAKMRGSKILGKEAECFIDEANAYKQEKGEIEIYLIGGKHENNRSNKAVTLAD